MRATVTSTKVTSSLFHEDMDTVWRKAQGTRGIDYALCLLAFRRHPNCWDQSARPFNRLPEHLRLLTRSATGRGPCAQLKSSWWCRYLKSKETLRVKQPKLAVAFRFLPVVHVPM